MEQRFHGETELLKTSNTTMAVVMATVTLLHEKVGKNLTRAPIKNIRSLKFGAAALNCTRLLLFPPAAAAMGT